MKIRASYGASQVTIISVIMRRSVLMENANYVLGTGTGNIVNGAAQKSFSNADLTLGKRHTPD
ncbi:MAG: hypothetical protein ACLR6J_06225 [Parabacteroides merdae]